MAAIPGPQLRHALCAGASLAVGLPLPAVYTAAIAAWCVAWWVTEPVPIEDVAERYLLRFKKQSHFEDDGKVIHAPKG